MTTLIERIFEAGIIQFGSFDNKSFAIRFDYLPSYPRLLTEIVDIATSAHNFRQYDYLVTDLASLPFAVGISLKSQIPLIHYSADQPTASTAFAGAYDVGHPACLITNYVTTDDDEEREKLIRRAGTVGLEIEAIACILLDSSAIDKTMVIPLMRQEDMFHELVANGHITKSLFDAI